MWTFIDRPGRRLLVMVGCLTLCTCSPGPSTATAPATAATTSERHSFPLSALPAEEARGAIAFHSDRDGRNRLFLVETATQVVRALTDGTDHHDQEPAWSADCRQIAYVTTRFDHRTFDIAVAGIDAVGAPRRLSSATAADHHPSWDVRRPGVVFSSNQDGTTAVFRIGLDGRGWERLTPLPDRGEMPAVSPDGSQLAYVGGSRLGLQVRVRHLTTGVEETASPPHRDAADPAWSSDGRRLAYAMVGPDEDSLVVRLTQPAPPLEFRVEGMAQLREPTWSPDGGWIAVAALRATKPDDWDILVVDLVNRRAHSVTTGPSLDRSPAWRPCP